MHSYFWTGPNSCTHTHRVEGSRGEGGTHAEWRVVGKKEGEEEEKEGEEHERRRERRMKEGEAHELNFDSTDFPGKKHCLQK